MALGYYAFLYYWLPIPIASFKGIHFPWNQLLGLIFFLINISHLLVGSLLLVYLLSKRPCLSLFEINAFAFFLTIIEYWGLQFLPLNPAHSLLRLAGSPTWASLGGVPLIAYLLYLSIFVSFTLNTFKTKVFFLLSCFALFVIPHFFQEIPQTQITFKVNLVQPRASNDLKRDFEKMSPQRQYFEISKNLIMQSGSVYSDIVIWPETALPMDFRNEDFTGKNNPEVFSAKYLNTRNLITGLYLKKDSTTNLVTNSTLHFRNNSVKGRYDKNYLKPFAETFPIESLNSTVEKLFSISYTIKRGKDYPPFDIDGFKIFATTCYEALKPEYTRAVLNKSSESPHLLINLANDNWFGMSSEPNMHFFMNQWRSLEFNLPVVRVANGGVSGVVYPWDIDHFKTIYPSKGSFIVDVKIPKSVRSSYLKYGILPATCLFIFFSVFFAFAKFFQKKKK